MILDIVICVSIIVIFGALGKLVQGIVIDAIKRAEQVNNNSAYIKARRKMHSKEDI